MRLTQKNGGAGAVAVLLLVVECLPVMHEALGSIPSDSQESEIEWNGSVRLDPGTQETLSLKT